ncbi:sigma 54-interacting transcriptional regulator [bacterium]|nr:sigma 54-interacting transcriptional regulator [bacterium]
MVAVTGERSPERVLQSIVSGLTSPVGFALTRVWVLGPGDLCETCRLARACSDKSQCLHLAASAGRSGNDPSITWDKIDGDFARFPLNYRKIGHIGATGEALLIENVADDTQWMIDQDWAANEGIRSFAGQPLVFRGDVLGVLGIFCREHITTEEFRWLRIFADQAAVALANARAFAEIERLKAELEDENALLREEVTGFDAHQELLGQSPAMRHLLEQVELVAPTDAAILILGESGSGKELAARAVHRRSRRADRPLVRVNCAAIPRELFESEFFGHVKGAFTGAVRDRVGRFQLADRGTLFLDEIGEIPLDLQSKLLRVLQEGEFERIGEATTRKVSVRIIAATNRDLKAEVLKGRFREDLYYRLSVFPVSVPPLRERREDIPMLLAHFVREATHRLGVKAPSVSAREVSRLQHYNWPGNVRELGHVVERAVIMARGGKADFSFVTSSTPGLSKEENSKSSPDVLRDKELRAEQIANIRRALDETGGRIYGAGGAAELLGIPPSTLTSRIRRWKIRN